MARLRRPPPPLRGRALLNDPALNKSTAFTKQERKRLRLDGLLPHEIETLDEQAARAYQAYGRKPDDLERHIYLRALQDTNDVLFYRLLLDHIEEMLPIVYTPVVALGCQEFSHIYRRPRGLFVSYPLRDSIARLLRNRPHARVDVIVVTDGERILGTGDQGVGGMGIPIGKLSLYTLIGGIHPTRTLPILLDVGTNNHELVNDREYLGWRHKRVSGQAYYDFLDQFVAAVEKELPGACVQWEDFSFAHARRILERYRDRIPTFNDDIQGTAAVTLGAILAALRVAGKSLKKQTIVFLGAGSASIGVADYLRKAMVEEGLAEREARQRFWIIDIDGLLHTGRSDLTAEQAVYAQPVERVSGWPRTARGNVGLAEVLGRIEAGILIGLSTARGAFTEPIVRAMARKTPRPIIFPLSNPTERAEARPQDLMEWTAGRAIVATGSPFDLVRSDGRRVPVAQCNNSYIFPAVGLALVVSGARRVTDGMMMTAARALAEHSPAARDTAAPLLPALTELRRTAATIAAAVAREAWRAGVAPNLTSGELRRRIRASQWTPAYKRVQ
jgi:malate dehydrogenase (oxaloacetate-decarboxylating)